MTVHSVFIIGPNKKLRLTCTFPPGTGRNVDEVLHVLDALQLTEGRKLTTPVNWKPGGDVIIAPLVNDEAARNSSGGRQALKPCLRRVPTPKD